MMKIFLIICLASGLASSEKLDRSYLPPPGSKFSGGSPGDIETPLEFPKQSVGPQLGNEKPELELGINRRPASPTGTPDQKPGLNLFQKSYFVPKTTTSYAITQTTTFAPDDEYIDQPSGFLNGSTVQAGFPGQNQLIRRPDQSPYKQTRPGQSQSTVAPYGTMVRPQFPGVFNGPEYLPPVSNKQSPAQVINQEGSSYPSGLPQGPKYQDVQAISVNQPGYVPQQNQYVDNQNIPSPASPQYQDGRFVPAGPGSQQTQNLFPGSQFPSTASPQYQDGQRLITPGSNQQSQFPSSTVASQYQGGQMLITPGSSQQNQFTGSQFPLSTAAPQYQDGQRLTTPGSNQQNQFSGNQDLSSSTTTPQSQFGQRFTPGLNQQVFGARVPSQQNQFTGNQYQENQNFPSSTALPTPGSVEQSQFSENQNFPSTDAPNYQDGQRFTTPGQVQGALIPGQQGFVPRIPDRSQNQFAGQNFPTSTSVPQFQDGARLTTPGYLQEGYVSPSLTQQNQNQYPGNENYPSSPAPQYQNSQQFSTPGSIGNQNFPSITAPNYQGGQRFTTPGQYQGKYVPEQQRFVSRIPDQPNQGKFIVNQNYPSSTAAPQYQNGQRFSIPGAQERYPQPNQQNQYPIKQNFPTSTATPQYQDGQRFSTPGSGQTLLNEYANQNFPTSTAASQYQGQRIVTPGQLLDQTTYPGSTGAPQYQQTFASTPGTNQQGVIPSQPGQFQRPIFNQQFPSSTASPQGFNPESQSQYGINIPTPGGQIYGNNQQSISQTGAGSPEFGAGAGFSSTTVGSLPGGDFASTPGFGNIGGRPERPQAEGDRNAEILNYESELSPEGYFYSYDTSNGIHADETGTVGNGTRAQGGFSYTGDDGKLYSVVYSADENGFLPRGDHLPTPPPIPEAIQRVIDQANKDKESGIDDDGSYNEEKYGFMKYEGPLTRLRSHNKLTPVVNGADIPDRAENGIYGQAKKTSITKGRKPVSNTGNNDKFESDYEETDMNGSKADETDMNEENRRVRPKPIKDLTVENNRSDEFKGTKMPLKSTTNSKTGSLQKNKAFERNGSSRRPIASGKDEENASDDAIEESKDNGDLQESQGLDYDSDLVNYKDDPSNRTDFHGLNKYLPESIKTNRKYQSSKIRPAIRIKGMKQSIGVKEGEKPEDRNNQGSDDSGLDFVDETRIRNQSGKNKIGQKLKDLSKIAGQTVSDSDDEIDYDDDRTDIDKDFGSNDEIKAVTDDRVRKPGTAQLKTKISRKPKRPNVNERTDMSDDKKIKPSSYVDNGYEYTPPQRKFGSEESIKFPSRVNQKEAQTTLRPVITKNVYDDDAKPADEYTSEYAAEKPGLGRPMTFQKQYPGYNQEGDSYNQKNPEVNEDGGLSSTRRPVSYGTSRPLGRPQTTGESFNQNNPQVNEDKQFSTTRRPVSYGTSRPFGRPQTAGTAHQEGGAIGHVYNPTIQSQRPGDKLFYNTNAPTHGTIGDVFSSTTPLPPSGPGYKYQRPSSQNRPTDGSYYDATPGGETYNAAISGQLPSTTYRPNYSFGEKISSPVTVDAFGRPIQSTNAPGFNRTLKPMYSTIRPSELENRPSDQFSPTEGRFGVTSTPGTPVYQSTSAPIREDFSGPKQPQTFDPQTGYHYK